MKIIVAMLLLGIIIIIHELGHFLLAKKNGITVTEFSVGMGPRIASFVKNGTRYSLKVLPFGGSCMMLGEDETIEDEGAFHKKSVWARFSVIFAGAFFNFILAFVLALIVLGNVGVDYPLVTGTSDTAPASEADFREGDRITEINGNKIHFSKDIDTYFLFQPLNGETVQITYERDGKEYKADVKPELIPPRYLLGINYSEESPNAEIIAIDPSFPLGQAGVTLGDVIVEVNGTKINSGAELRDYFTQNPLTDQKVTVSYVRDGKENAVTVTPRIVGERYDLGVYYNYTREKVSPFETVKYSVYEIRYWMKYTFSSIRYLVTGKASVKEIAGPVGIVNVVGQVVDEAKDEGTGMVLLNLANFGILLSTNLGVMNLLPLPALDGGRLVFLIIEAIRRKPVPKEKEAMVHFIGMALLMALMVFVLFNDIRNIFG